jgi:subtilisin family serine protease
MVAVIDTGVDYNHEDLAANIWTNPGESGNGKETNGIDDDDNGYIDDFRGWDFYDNDNKPNILLFVLQNLTAI